MGTIIDEIVAITEGMKIIAATHLFISVPSVGGVDTITKHIAIKYIEKESEIEGGIESEIETEDETVKCVQYGSTQGLPEELGAGKTVLCLEAGQSVVPFEMVSEIRSIEFAEMPGMVGPLSIQLLGMGDVQEQLMMEEIGMHGEMVK